jgi:hypothetical protein
MGRAEWIALLQKLADGDGLVAWYPRLEEEGGRAIRWARAREGARRALRDGWAAAAAAFACALLGLWAWVVGLGSRFGRERGYDRLAELEAAREK